MESDAIFAILTGVNSILHVVWITLLLRIERRIERLENRTYELAKKITP